MLFLQNRVDIFDHVVDKNGLHVGSDKVKTMLELLTPTNILEVRRTVGTFSWYSRFISEFSSIISPINGLLKKNAKFNWTQKSEDSFKMIKECFVGIPILNYCFALCNPNRCIKLWNRCLFNSISP